MFYDVQGDPDWWTRSKTSPIYFLNTSLRQFQPCFFCCTFLILKEKSWDFGVSVSKNHKPIRQQTTTNETKKRVTWTIIKRKTRTSVAACTWLASEVTPNLTRLLLTLLADELMELTDSWLPERSRAERSPEPRERDMGLGVLSDMAPPKRVTLCTGANRPWRGLQSKYL